MQHIFKNIFLLFFTSFLCSSTPTHSFHYYQHHHDQQRQQSYYEYKMMNTYKYSYTEYLYSTFLIDKLFLKSKENYSSFINTVSNFSITIQPSGHVSIIDRPLSFMCNPVTNSTTSTANGMSGPSRAVSDDDRDVVDNAPETFEPQPNYQTPINSISWPIVLLMCGIYILYKRRSLHES